jgi:hypothetical protein
MRNPLIGLILVLASVANAAPPNNSIVAEQVVSNQVGKLRFVLNNLGTKPFKLWEPTPAEIVVFRATGEVLQKLSVEVELETPFFDFIDLNDDGNVDLLLYSSCAGFATCAGPTRAADVYLFASKLGRFVKSKTMSGRGEISKSKNRGCVVASYKSGLAGYTAEEWCFNISTGRWKMVGSSGGEPGE